MDRFDAFLMKHYRGMKKRLVPAAGECPREELLWEYARGKLAQEMREEVDGHLLACPSCLESFKAIRMLVEAEGSQAQVPAHLHEKAREILKKALPSKERPLIMRLSLLWDEVHNRIERFTAELGAMLTSPMPEFQPVRNGHEVKKEVPQGFPLRRSAETEEGRVSVEIDRSGREGYLSLKVSLRAEPAKIPGKLTDIRAVLHKSDRVCSSVYLDERGEAVFSRIREGDYSLELSAGERSLGRVEFSVEMGKG